MSKYTSACSSLRSGQLDRLVSKITDNRGKKRDVRSTETKTVFLGGTCNDSTWRSDIKRNLKIKYFDPVVDDWTPECMEEEIRQREICQYCLYVITPRMSGLYSIAEVVDDSNKRPEKTIFCILFSDSNLSFTEGQKRSLMQVGKMVENNGGKFFTSLENTTKYLNGDI